MKHEGRNWESINRQMIWITLKNALWIFNLLFLFPVDFSIQYVKFWCWSWFHALWIGRIYDRSSFACTWAPLLFWWNPCKFHLDAFVLLTFTGRRVQDRTHFIYLSLAVSSKMMHDTNDRIYNCYTSCFMLVLFSLFLLFFALFCCALISNKAT